MYGMIYDVIYDTIWYNMIWYDMIWYMMWYDMIQYDIIWYKIWYDMIRYDIIHILVMDKKEHTVLLCQIVKNIALLHFDYKDLIYFLSVWTSMH
jgi:hypothetical protein